MRFEVRFHTPFRVATGRSGDGVDTVVDPDTPVPASSLKGVMRSAAWDLLQLDRVWVDAVFGSGDERSPWSWSDGRVLRSTDEGGEMAPDPAFDSVPARVRLRARIQIAPDTSTVVDGALAVMEEVTEPRVEFSVVRAGWIEPDDVARHETVLLASARAVTAIGGDRRRGLGWVSITPIDPPWPVGTAGTRYADALVDALAALPAGPEANRGSR
jgi:CRISPR/Cas system CMR subunit Cmr4 (Cas7 group RAMP superfamily)